MAVIGERELTRGVVVDAAAELLAVDGLDALNLTRLAQQIGVTQPALYRHIEGIDDLWRELGLRGRAELVESLTEAAIGRSGAESVVATANAWRSFTQAKPDLYAATDRHPCADDPELTAAVERVVGVLALSLRGFGLDEASTVDAARMLRSALHGFVHLEMGDGHPHAHDNDVSFDRMIELLCAGFDQLSRTQTRP